MKRAAAVIAAVLLVAVATLATSAAQSPNAFGVPSADQPQPGAAIKAVPGSRAQGWLSQGRSEVLARHGMVATSDPLAAEAGLEILRRGGNAIDAAVATGAVLDVTSQNDTGIGGDLFALVYVAKDKKLYALNSGGWAPAGWTPEFFTTKLGVKTVPNSGVNSATVPGAISGYDALLKRFGTLGFKDTFERAARLADEGWGLAERRHSDLKSATNGLRNDPDSKETFLVDGRDAGALQHHPESGARQGAAADPGAGPRRVLPRRDCRRDRREGAGQRRRDDEGRPRGIPVRVDRADLDQLPRLRRLRAAAARPGLRRARDAEHPRSLRAEVRHQPRRARPGRSAGTGTTWSRRRSWPTRISRRRTPTRSSPTVPVEQLLSKEHAASLCGRIDPNVASKPAVKGGTDGGTIYLTTADRWGNMVSLIHSVFSVYGSRATVAPYGFVLHNRGGGVLARPGEPQHRRAAQAAVPHDHRRVRHEGRRAADDVRQHGRQRAARDARAAHGQPDRSRDERADDDRRRALHAQSELERAVARGQPVRPGRRGAQGQGTRGPIGDRRIGRRLSGHPVHARSADAGADLRSRAAGRRIGR